MEGRGEVDYMLTYLTPSPLPRPLVDSRERPRPFLPQGEGKLNEGRSSI